MSVLYDIEFKIIPDRFQRNKIDTFSDMSHKESYLCDLFNEAYKIAYEDKLINKKVKFKETDFKTLDFSMGYTFDSDTNTKTHYYVYYIQLPKPNKSDIPKVFCGAFLVPYSIQDDTLKVYNLYGLEIGTLFETYSLGTIIDGKHINCGSVRLRYNEVTEKALEHSCGKLDLINIKI